jgi:hypothetical protein
VGITWVPTGYHDKIRINFFVKILSIFRVLCDTLELTKALPYTLIAIHLRKLVPSHSEGAHVRWVLSFVGVISNGYIRCFLCLVGMFVRVLSIVWDMCIQVYGQ